MKNFSIVLWVIIGILIIDIIWRKMTLTPNEDFGGVLIAEIFVGILIIFNLILIKNMKK